MNERAQTGACGEPDLLKVDDVTLQYKTPQHVVTATYKVSFTVRESERYVILGPSGCGKSTLLKAVGGFMAPVAGNISISRQARQRTGARPDDGVSGVRAVDALEDGAAERRIPDAGDQKIRPCGVARARDTP